MLCQRDSGQSTATLTRLSRRPPGDAPQTSRGRRVGGVPGHRPPLQTGLNLIHFSHSFFPASGDHCRTNTLEPTPQVLHPGTHPTGPPLRLTLHNPLLLLLLLHTWTTFMDLRGNSCSQLAVVHTEVCVPPPVEQRTVVLSLALLQRQRCTSTHSSPSLLHPLHRLSNLQTLCVLDVSRADERSRVGLDSDRIQTRPRLDPDRIQTGCGGRRRTLVFLTHGANANGWTTFKKRSRHRWLQWKWSLRRTINTAASPRPK